jgi:hypothetical protein
VPGVLAHQGGWDEILLIVGPIVVVVGMLRLLKKRVERNAAADGPNGTAPNGTAPDDTGEPAPTASDD